MNILQKDIVMIQKLQLLIRDSQIKEIDNTGVINVLIILIVVECR